MTMRFDMDTFMQERPDNISSKSWRRDGEKLRIAHQAQDWMITNQAIPTRAYDHDPRAILEGAGVAFGDTTDDTGRFCSVILPEGWRMVSESDNPLRTNLIDDKGRVRAGMYCESLDESASQLEHLYCMYYFYLEDVIEDGRRGKQVWDFGGELLYETSSVAPADQQGEVKGLRSFQEEKCLDWLDSHYPGWEWPGAYWPSA